MKISIPELSLVLLVGPSGGGKSSFARKHFLPTEVVSSDFCRALVSDNENDQSATGDAFDLLHEIIRKRLTRGRLTVVDATNVQSRRLASPSLLSRRSTTCSPRPLSSISPSGCARIAMLFVRIGSLDRMLFAISPSNSGVRYAVWNARESATSSSFPLRKRSIPSRSSVSRYGITGKPSTVLSTSLATYTVASMNWSSCWDSLATQSTNRTVSTLPPHLMDADSSSWGIWLIAVPARYRFSASSHTWFNRDKLSVFPATTI